MANQNVSRRSFLKTTAAALAIPYLVKSTAMGKDGAVAPSNRLIIGGIGMGGQCSAGLGCGFGPYVDWAPKGGFMDQPGVHAIAVCDVKKNMLERAQAAVNMKYGNKDCAGYSDFRELLARPDIDIIITATGDRWHPLVSIAAAKAGKDIYCEKPMAMTIHEAKAVRDTFDRTGRIFQLGSQQRSSREFRFACELVRNGYIGKLERVVVQCGGISKPCDLGEEPMPDNIDYDMWLGPSPWRPYHSGVMGWMAWRDFTIGEIANWGNHHFDIAQWGIGADAEDTCPTEINPPDKDHKFLTYKYANGVIMEHDTNGLGIHFYGTDGDIYVMRGILQTNPVSLQNVKIGPNEIHLHEANNHHTDFLNSVKSRTLPGTNHRVGSRSISVCCLGYITYLLNRPLKYDPQKWQFVNDPEADKFLSRSMRAPWTI